MLKKSVLNRFAKQINSKNYNSDVWLKSNWVMQNGDELNSPELGYIPDLINRKYKYIIECDGSIHDRPDIKTKDLKKEVVFIEHKYTVFRVRYLDLNSLKDIQLQVLRIIKRPFIRNRLLR